ncbi:helix-turn-helix domain-containing protein [Halostagnicola sp. A-GB9-2]|uniref:helix-turn-helix domain-containing protein n=1 Tax=Halostagnicola sp. A-GB9-2 TaxID=3048066 RepID=UPI0024C03D46|nr:helix-turn-helix domain-containing protein [Halostagnicola sp. A-GB9-2]MDJ1431474.1 helix-turn-helix domain-containing protein [Halostagnicola sp. A-GB9-2]
MTRREPDMEDLMRIDDPEFDQVLECVFGIHAHERRTYFALLEAPGSTVSELADDLERDRSSVNRSLSTLDEKNLIERDRKILGGGGYVYQYFPTPIPEAKELMHSAVDRWAADVHDQIDSFDS